MRVALLAVLQDSGKTSYDNKSSRSGSNSEHGGVSGPTRSQMKNPLQNQINHANSSGASASCQYESMSLPPLRVRSHLYYY